MGRIRCPDLSGSERRGRFAVADGVLQGVDGERGGALRGQRPSSGAPIRRGQSEGADRRALERTVRPQAVACDAILHHNGTVLVSKNEGQHANLSDFEEHS